MLADLGLSHNEMSCLVLLALLGLKPENSWDTSTNYSVGIFQIVTFFEIYGRRYTPNYYDMILDIVSQFVDAGLVVDLEGFTYQIADDALKVLQS